MPRKASVPHEELKAAILAKAENIVDGQGRQKGPRDAVYIAIREALDCRISTDLIYQYIHENRHTSYDDILNHLGIQLSEGECAGAVSQTTEEQGGAFEDFRVSSSLSSEECASSDTENPTKHKDVVQPQQTFRILLDRKEWELIKPVEKVHKRKDRTGKRKMLVLPPYQWEEVLIDKLWTQHKIPCPYTFEKATVHCNPEERKEFVKITAYCRECNSTGVGTILVEPIQDEAVALDWRANDTRAVRHSLKRPLRGDQRSKVRTLLCSKSAAVYRRHRATNVMELGDLQPPTLWKNDVVRKAKQEVSDAELKICTGADPIDSLLNMKYPPTFAGSIHDLSFDRFCLRYPSPAQRLLYQKYCKSSNAVLVIDATGGLVKKLPRPHGVSAHIFLYQAVIDTGEIQLPVWQVLSERHDANSIQYWLNDWLVEDKIQPKEVVIDNSAALKSAISRTFCKCLSADDCKEKYFAFLMGTSDRLPQCFLRIDVAHFIKAARNWTVWKEASLKRLADFYLRCLGTLIKSTTLQEFRLILLNVLIVTLSPCEGEGSEGMLLPMENSLRLLTRKIKGASDILYYPDKVEKVQEVQVDLPFDEDENGPEKVSCINQWISGIRNEAEEAVLVCQDSRPNPYFSEAVANEFHRLAKDFPFWSAVMVKPFKSTRLTASSALVDSSFADLKNNILEKGHTLQMHKFVAIHLKSIEGQCRISDAAGTKLTLSAGEKRARDEISVLHPNENTPVNTPTDTLVMTSLSTTETTETHADAKNNELLFDPKTVNSKVLHSDETGATEGKAQKTEAPVIGCTRNTVDCQAPLSGSQTHVNIDEEFDLEIVENWKGLGTAGRRQQKKCKYLTVFPELDAAIHGDQLKQPSKVLLRNGNLCSAIRVENTDVQLSNTCAFDSLCQVIASGYIEDEHYRAVVDTSDNALLQTCQSLATLGAVKSTYQLRAKTIMAVMEPHHSLNTPMATRHTSRSKAVVYDCYGSVVNLAKQLLSAEPSAVREDICRSGKCEVPPTVYTLLEPNVNILFEGGLAALEKAVHEPLNAGLKYQKCSCGMKIKESEVTPGEHLFVDVEVLSSVESKHIAGPSHKNHREYALEEFPTSITVTGTEYFLCGVIAYVPRHYLAYCRRTGNVWALYNDLAKTVLPVRPDTKNVQPHILVYLKHDAKRLLFL